MQPAGPGQLGELIDPGFANSVSSTPRALGNSLSEGFERLRGLRAPRRRGNSAFALAGPVR